jgi:hypothetical protein
VARAVLAREPGDGRAKPCKLPPRLPLLQDDPSTGSLKKDKSLEAIKVKSVDNGLVLLDGSTTSLADELRAIETVYGLPGVGQVASEIEAKEKQAGAGHSRACPRVACRLLAGPRNRPSRRRIATVGR